VAKTAEVLASFRFRLDSRSGVPIYRQLIDQVTGGIAAGALHEGMQLPTVRQLAVDLSINPNTVIRAYSELEIRGILNTEQGTGTFIGRQNAAQNATEHQRLLSQFVGEFVSRAGSSGFTIEELIEQLQAIPGVARKSSKEKETKRNEARS
jgi:GntR family transcriptional regulator